METIKNVELNKKEKVNSGEITQPKVIKLKAS